MPNTMQIFKDLKQWRTFRKTCAPSLSIGFVPTLGVLHQGHASLMRTSQHDNDMTVVSIFLNRTQFNNPDDLTRYPQTLEADLALLEAQGVDACLLPQHEAIYHDQYRFRVTETEQNQCMEGEKRPGHFTGMLTIVMKLLQLVQPTRAYFGEKDYQQLQLVRDMVNAFFMDIEIKGCPTIREASMLPYSSRNQRLSAQQRVFADQFAQIFHQTPSIEETIEKLTALGITIDYIEEHDHRRFAAVYIDDIRLIDNYTVTSA